MKQERGGILFIENREKTHFWAAVARELERAGLPVSWIVQNPLFASDLPGDVYVLPFPVVEKGGETLDPDQFPLLCTDRGSQYFEAGRGHYPPYAGRIEDLLDSISPALVVGESTLFHELLAVDACRRRGIAYVHPAAARYPANRFMMFEADTQIPYVAPGGRMDPALALAQAERIGAGREIPTYMKSAGRVERLKRRLLWAATRVRIWAAHVAGERYNTPSLRRKLALGLTRARSVKRWKSLTSQPEPGERSILYPLQMQPEANIDVWGRPFSDQAEVVERMLAAVGQNATVSVKANPKTKYEISQELLRLAERDPRVHLLPLHMPMKEAHDLCIGAVTICGTVGLEAVFGRGRCVSVRHPVISDHFPLHSADTPEEAAAMLLGNPKAGVGSVERGAQLLQQLHAETFPGFVSDPFSDPHCVEPENAALVAEAVQAAYSKAAGGAERKLRRAG